MRGLAVIDSAALGRIVASKAMEIEGRWLERVAAEIFEPFKRGHTSKAGTGLGLAIARQAIEAQGGTIHAESPGVSGCHFWFTLPHAAPASEISQRSASS